MQVVPLMVEVVGWSWPLRRVTYERVMSHMKESCHIKMRHVTYEGVTLYVIGSRYVRRSHVICEGVVSCMKESCHV